MSAPARFETAIAAFAAALDDPSAPPPAATRGRLGAPDRRRFSVYRNNVAAGLIGAIEARYPVSRRIAGDERFRAMARAFVRAHKPRSPVMIAYGGEFPEFLAGCEGVEPSLADVARLENAWVEAYHAEDAAAATLGELAALTPDCLPGTRIVFHPAARLLRFLTPAASLWAAAQEGGLPAAPNEVIGEDALVARPGCDVGVRVLPPLGFDFALLLREGATLAAGRGGDGRPRLRLRDPSRRTGRVRRGHVHHSRAAVMIADAARSPAPGILTPIARLTGAAFGLIPASLPLLILRIALARPFFASGLTRWDGWFTLSFGAKALFADEYKLHIFGSEIPFPAPDLVAAMASTAEIALPVLLAFGFLTRWAALGLLCMTGVIQLTYPDGWANFHLYWGGIALALMTFGPGAISFDRLIGLDGWSSGRRGD